MPSHWGSLFCENSGTLFGTLPPFSKAHFRLQVLDFIGAGDEIRTHDPNLGKVVLYP